MTGFIFDMDGVLLDSIHIWFESEQYILDRVGITLSKEERDELNTLTLEEAGVWFHERFGVLGSGDEVAQAIIDYMLGFYRDQVEAKSGAIEFVRALHEAGAPICVLSSSPQAFIQAGLAHAGLRGFFSDDRLISAEDSGLTKRAPETFEKVCSLLGTQPSDTWLFDDSWYALQTANGVGLHCAGIHSSDKCGTHDELVRYCEVVAEDFAALDPADYL